MVISRRGAGGRVRGDRPPAPSFGCAVLPSPVGDLSLYATDQGIYRLSFTAPPQGSTAEAPTGAAESHLVEAVQALERYFRSGAPPTGVRLDWRLATPFQRRVLELLRAFPRRRVLTYGGLARAVGCAGGARAVGRALATNPFPILVPCHRVVRADRALGGYVGGEWRKRRLLEVDGILPGPLRPGTGAVGSGGEGAETAAPRPSSQRRRNRYPLARETLAPMS